MAGNTWEGKKMHCRVVHSISLFCASMRLSAQSYPYWDAADPSVGGEFYNPGGAEPVGPVIATTNEIFSLRENSYDQTLIGRWTKSGGWEDLPGITIDGYESGAAHSSKMMTFHDNYLYVVGLFRLDGYTTAADNSDLCPFTYEVVASNEVQIARFDLNTGTWSPVGQDFVATNVDRPSTIAVDTNGWIYVGFDISKKANYNEDTGAYDEPLQSGSTIDMLNMSTNGGLSWQQVGSGFIIPEDFWPDGVGEGVLISALSAEGTNIYIGGDFAGAAGGVVSPNVIMWTNGWRALAGISQDSISDTGDDVNGLHVINEIATIGTNIYVAGSFVSPHVGLARFSNVTGESLPVGDTQTYLGWSKLFNEATIGLSLTINNGHLYLGGFYGPDGASDYVAYLTDPQDANPTDWVAITNANTSMSVQNGKNYLAAAPCGSAVYVWGRIGGEDGFGNSSDGFSRWVTGPDVPCPSASITNVVWDSINNTSTLAITGTPGSRWQVISSTDLSTWSWLRAVTLWGGTNTFIDTSIYGSQPYYELTNYCSQSLIAPCDSSYTLCITNNHSRDVEYIITDASDTTLATGGVSTGSSTSCSFSASYGQTLYIEFYNEWDDDTENFIPTQQNGFLSIDNGFGVSYVETGGPLCP